jgi:hypothetical protein
VRSLCLQRARAPIEAQGKEDDRFSMDYGVGSGED